MIYFDNGSTTKISEPVYEKMCGFLKDNFANPSSLHILGFQAEKELIDARKKIAFALKVTPEEIYFTSGGTEANNTAVLGIAEAYKKRGNKVITTNIEHPSVSDSFKELEARGFDVVVLNADEKGYISLEELEREVDENTILVSIMYVNNEVGTIQPVEKIADIIKKKNPNCFFHTDCVQAFGKHNIDGRKFDAVSVSGHKIHCPKGIGVLYLRKGVRAKNLHFGGGQEKGFRPGTENTGSIVAMGLGAEIAVKDMAKNFENVKAVKEKLMTICNILPEVYVNGDSENASPYILNLSFEGVKGEVLLHALENYDIFVATGSACSSRAKEKKKIVDFLIDGRGASTVRFSFDCENTVEEAEKVIEVLKEQVPLLRMFQPR